MFSKSLINIQKSVISGGIISSVLIVSSACQKKETLNKVERPNILLCIADDATFSHFSKYGCRWVKTPAFDYVAENGILFNNAYTSNAKSAPSRACLLTGRNSWQLEEAGNHIGYWPKNKYKTYMEALEENGYNVGYTGKTWAPGNSLGRNLTGKAYQTEFLIPPTTEISKINYAGNFEKFLNENSQDQPWCFWYGSFEPHRDYEYGSGIRTGGKNTKQIDKVPSFWPDNDSIRTDLLDYALEIEYFDKHIGLMIEMLRKKGMLENTIIVITSDNGMPFPRCKGITYDYSSHMPLAVMWPKGIKNKGRIVNEYISFIDLAPTFIETAGLDAEKTGMEPMEGKSITDIFNDTKKHDRSYILLGQERHDAGRPQNQGYPVRSIIKDGFLYSYNFKPELWPMGNPFTGYLNTDGSPTKTTILNLKRTGRDKAFWNLNFGKHPQEELYQISVDKECILNLAYSDEYVKVKNELQKILFDNLKKQKDPRVLEKGDIFDSYPFFEPSMSNFYERYMNGEKIKTSWVNDSDYEKEDL
jgi:arylsulfatase A-like enzyme